MDPHAQHTSGDGAAHPQSADTYGLAVATGGYRLGPAVTVLPAATPQTFAFQIRDSAGTPRTDFAVEHDVPLQLIVIRRDLTGFQHLHPAVDANGTWSTPLTLPEPGPYRVFADTVVGGANGTTTPLTLGADVFVAGVFQPTPIPAPNRVATAGPYTVRLDQQRGPGRAAKLRFTVERGGRPVTDLQPYLGALGHLVALRAGDLAYLHVHPDDAADAGPTVGCATTFSSAGDYRLFLQIAHQDAIVTTSFTAHLSDKEP